jgi:hypothetical protein
MPKKREVREKEIGDTSSFTIPHEFTHVLTGKKVIVTKELLNYINALLVNRNLMHAIMTGLYEQTQNKPQNLTEINDKLDKILQRLSHH